MDILLKPSVIYQLMLVRNEVTNIGMEVYTKHLVLEYTYFTNISISIKLAPGSAARVARNGGWPQQQLNKYRCARSTITTISTLAVSSPNTVN